MDGTVRNIEVDAQVTGKEIRSIIVKKLGLTDQFGFSIFCAIDNKVSKTKFKISAQDFFTASLIFSSISRGNVNN